MLFGAGLLIFMNKPGADPGEVRALYYRRTGLLILFGLFNAYLLLWPGDILFTYGVVGCCCSCSAISLPGAARLGGRRSAADDARAFRPAHIAAGFRECRGGGRALGPGAELNEQQQGVISGWEAYLDDQGLTEASQRAEIATRQSGYLENFVHSAGLSFFLQRSEFRRCCSGMHSA